MENAFLWLAGQFGPENIAKKEILLPTQEYFPFTYDGRIESLTKTAEIVARQMEIDFGEIELHTYEENIQEFRGDVGFSIWTEVDPNSDVKLAAGLYFEKNERGQYDIFVEKTHLTHPENLVAVLSHEFSHIKLLGEQRIEKNDESLTDLTTVIFGLGIFNAKAAFQEFKSFYGYSHNSIGYLKQREWGYALALYAYYRQEAKSDWVNYLTPNLKSDFRKSMDFILSNPDGIFKEEYKG